MPSAHERSKSHLLVALGLSLCVACTKEYSRPIVSGVDLRESGARPVVDDAAVLDGLATYDEYDPNVLSRDLERVERYYRARGYYEAKVTAARVLGLDPAHVSVEIRVVPGEPVLVHRLDLPGLANLPFALVPEVTAARTLSVGDVFDEARFDDMKEAILEKLQNSGYPYAKVDAKAHIDLKTHQADIDVNMEPGPLSTFGEIKIVGLKDIPEGPVRDNLGLKPGERYSRARLLEAEKAVQNLGVFANVEVREDLSHPENRSVPLDVIVREGAMRNIRLGGGATFDVLKLNLHLRMGWEHLNFLGGTRFFSINAYPGIDLYPTRLDGTTPVAPTRVLLENSIQMQFRQPAFIEGRTTGTVNANYDIKPLLYPLPGGTDPKQERIVGYQTLSTSFGLERKWFFPSHVLPGSITIAPSYNWIANYPFTYQSDLPAGLANVRVAYPALVSTFDFRDNPINPHKGVYFTNSVQVADRIFGGSVSDVRIQPELRAFVPITKKSVTLAVRTGMGFLIPRDYGDTLNENGQRGPANPEDPAVVFDQEKLLLRAFYSGGMNSNRGYPLRGVGPHGPVGFLVPTGANCSGSVDQLPAACIRPLGGFTLWEASLELRFPIAGDLGGVAFADASDVTRDVGHVRFNVPHLSVGPGLRYQTPVGPLRLDIGYRVPGAQALGRSSLSAEEGGNATGTLFGVDWLPVAINIALQEAF